MAVANGAEYETGTFTTNNETSYTLEFNKSFRKYMYFIEMTDESKDNLIDTGQTSAKMYACCGVFPTPEADSQNPGNGAMLSYRIVPTTSVTSVSAPNVSGIDEDSISMTNNNPQNGANVLYRGYSYNYYVVSLDDM